MTRPHFVAKSSLDLKRVPKFTEEERDLKLKEILGSVVPSRDRITESIAAPTMVGYIETQPHSVRDAGEVELNPDLRGGAIGEIAPTPSPSANPVGFMRLLHQLASEKHDSPPAVAKIIMTR